MLPKTIILTNLQRAFNVKSQLVGQKSHRRHRRRRISLHILQRTVVRKRAHATKKDGRLWRPSSRHTDVLYPHRREISSNCFSTR